MIRSICSTLLFTSVFLPLTAQTPLELDGFPSVSVFLPSNIPSETVQISYFLIGPFGGYGSYTKQQPGLQSYEISTVLDGKAASEIKMIVYASGCEIKTFVLPLAGDSRLEEEFKCQRAATVQLSGQIVQTELVRGNNAELVVDYMAYWAHGFFGITDGIATKFRLATVSPGSNGVFRVELPYFTADTAGSSSPRASFRLMLRDSKTWNDLASNLEPEISEFRLKTHELQILPHYPDGLKFTAVTL